MILFLSNLVITVFEINNSKQLDKVGKIKMQIHSYYYLTCWPDFGIRPHAHSSIAETIESLIRFK